jgi:hypothetical protein
MGIFGGLIPMRLSSRSNTRNREVFMDDLLRLVLNPLAKKQKIRMNEDGTYDIIQTVPRDYLEKEIEMLGKRIEALQREKAQKETDLAGAKGEIIDAQGKQ